MNRITLVLAILFFILPSISSAAALTQQQSTSLIAVVQSSPGTPASAFVSLITAFSNITVTQATSLITVVQAAPGVPANAFVDLLTSFTVDTPATQTTTPAITPTVTPNTTSVAPTATTQSTNSSTQNSSSSLIASKNTAYANQTVIAGSNNVKLGSFVLSQNTGANVSSIYLDFIGNASVTNLTLKDNATGNLISSATRITPTTSTDNGFSVNLQIQSWETRKIDVYGNIPSGTIGTIQATLNTKTGGTLTNSGNSILLASAVPLQIITVRDLSPKIFFLFNGSESSTSAYTTKVGDGVRLGWSSNTNYCKASGDWSGEKAGSSDPENMTFFDHAGVFHYILSCTSSAGETVTNTATITVTAPEIQYSDYIFNNTSPAVGDDSQWQIQITISPTTRDIRVKKAVFKVSNEDATTLDAIGATVGGSPLWFGMRYSNNILYYTSQLQRTDKNTFTYEATNGSSGISLGQLPLFLALYTLSSASFDANKTLMANITMPMSEWVIMDQSNGKQVKTW